MRDYLMEGDLCWVFNSDDDGIKFPELGKVEGDTTIDDRISVKIFNSGSICMAKFSNIMMFKDLDSWKEKQIKRIDKHIKKEIDRYKFLKEEGLDWIIKNIMKILKTTI